MIGIVQVGWQGYADRYSYIPSIGIFVAVVWLAADVAESRRWQREALVSAAVVLVALALTTWSQLPYWHDDLTLFQHALAVTSANPAAEYHFGGDLVDLGRNREAIPHFQEMIRLQPDYYAAYYMLGKAQAAEGDNEPALQNFSEALRLNPDYVEPYYARAMMFFKTGNQLAAERDFREALKRGLSAEWAADAHNALGAVAGQQGNLQAALAEFEQAVRLRPTLVVAQQNLANALVAAGRIREAITQLEQALSATHGDASIRKMLDDLRVRS